MKNRILSLFLAFVMLLGILPTASFAADTPEDALGEIDIYNGDHEIAYLSINGSVRTQKYTYYNYTTPEGWVRETPAYCVNPNLYGVPQTVGPGESIKYIANEKASDPKVVGIICNGYPHYSLSALNLDDKYQAYYATKMALWCYLMPDWNINNLKIAPGLSASDQEIAKRVLDAATKIYKAGTTYNYMLEPKLTATPDRSVAYPVTVDGRQYKQQIFTIQSETFVYDYEVKVAFSDPAGVPSGTRIVNMDNQDITAVTTDGNKGQFKILYPVESIEGETGSVQLTLNAAVAKYAVMYAICAQKDEYGNLQNYICDIDNNAKLEVATISNYYDSPDDEIPEETSLRIIKLEEGTEIPLEGAVFSVYDPDGKKLGSYSTNANGTVTIPLTLEGHYTVTEDIPPEYHLLPNIRTQHADVEYGKMATVTFTNAPYGSLKVLKLSDTGDALNGVTVQIKHIESGEVITGTTQIGGAVVFDQLKPGAYEVKETAGISGWIADTDTIQTVTVIAGKTSDVTIINKELPGLRIIKYDRSSHTVMAGVTFAVYRDGTFLGNYTTDLMGEILISDAEPGTYRVYEVETGDDSHVLDTTPQEIELKAGDGILELVFFNSLKPGIHLVKVDSVTMEPLPNVRFEFKLVGGSYRQEFVTDINGEIDLSNLDPGAYEVRELEAPDGYLIDDAVRVIQINPDEDASFVFTNTPKPSLRLIKRSSDGTQLAGVHFRIAKIEDGTHYLDRITDDNGEINISGLEPGVYSVQETATVADHVLDLREYHVELFPGQTSTITIENQKRPSLTIRKTDKDTGEPIEGVTFTLRGADGPTITTEPTGPDGTVTIYNLLPGTYTVTEQNVPENYILDTTPQTVTLFANREATVQFQNYKRPTLKIAKVDINGKFLTGATFEVKTKDGVKIGDFPVDADGKITVSNVQLDEGYYIITEIQAPAGYILDSTPHEVYLRPGKTTEVSITNEKKPSLTIRKTDKDTGEPVPGVTFTLQQMEGPTITTEPTGPDGTVTIPDLMPGIYTVTEQSVPEGYILDTTPQTVTLFADRDSTVQFQNYKRPTLVISKVDINGRFLTGAVFEVKTKAGVKIGDFPVGADGKITVSNVNLDEGYYIITEIQAPEGYILDSTPHEVYLRPGKTTEISIENEKKPGLTIYKIDSVVGDGVKGAKFKIYVAKDMNPNGTYQELDSSFYYTDENGIIHLDNLDTGWYKIVEVEPPAGYMLKDPSEQIIYIEHDKAVEVTFENIPKSALVIRKIDAATGAPLANAWFRVRYLGGTSGSGGTIIGEHQTSSNGNIVITGLDAGTYVVEEISAPNGYVMDTAPQTAYISGKEQDCITLTFTNSKYGSLLIKKVDSVTGEPLSDVQFFITDSDGSVVGNSNGYFTTDSAGTILVSDIMPGTTLVVKETRTKSGYVLDNVPQTVKIESNETMTLEFRNQPLGSLLIRKVCAVNPSVTLSNAEFKVAYSDGTLIGDSNGVYRSDENGEVRIDGLIPGKSVVVTETKAPDGFIIDTQSQTAVIQSGKTVSLTFKNQPKGGIIVQKRDSITGQPLPGAQFRITTAAGCEVGLDGVIGSSTLTQNGIFTTDSSGEIRISNLAPGVYVLTEIQAPAGYVMDSPSTNVVIGANGDTQTVIVTNTPKGGLIVEKYDSVTKRPLSGAEFKITTASGELVADNEGLTSSNGLYTTDVNGQIVLSKLLPGTYIVTETRAPDNYQIDPKSQTVVVNAGDTQTIRFYDDPLCTLTILKRDAVTRKPLANATFVVRDSEGRAIGPNNGLYTTGSDGTVTVSGLTPNATIVVSETKAPSGYILDETPKTIVVRSGVANSLIFDNQPGTTLVIRKYIEGTDYEPLAGVCFKVTDGSGAAVGPDDGVYYTDKSGEIVLEGIEPGTTVIAREIKTVEGYVIDGTPQDILIKGGEVQRLTFWNKKAGTLVIQKKDSVSGALIAGAQFQLTYATGGYVDNDNGHLSSNGLYTTDANGEIRISGITGTVVAKEVQAAPGYVIDSSTQTQTVTVNPEDTQTLVFLNEPLCSLTLTKLDSVTGKPVPGTVFEVKDGSGNVIGRYTTGSDGTVTVTGLIPGNTYVVTEVKVPDGYVLDSTPQVITVTNGANTMGGNSGSTGSSSGSGNGLTFENDPTMTLTIRKYIEGTDYEPLAGVCFKVTDGSGAAVGSGDGTFYTNAAGEIVIEGLEPGTTVTAREVKTVEGFVLDGTPKTVKITADSRAPELIFWNKRAGTLVIQKKDSVSGALIAGAQFQLTYANGGYVDNDNGHLSSNGLYTTDANGEIRISGITGTVVAKEVQAAPGYVIERSTQTQTVVVNPMDTQTLVFLNEPLCSLTLTKLDSVTGKPVPGTEFTVTDGNGNIIGRYVTGTDGTVVVTGLIPGNTYVVYESRVPDGYVLDSTPQTITVTNGTGNTVTSGGSSNGSSSGNGLTFTNDPTMTLTIHKYIEGTANEPLAGVAFKITDGSGAPLNPDGGIYYTNSAGEIVLEGLEPGTTITAQEIKTVDGYVLDGNPQTIKIEAGNGQNLTFWNKPAGALIIRKLDKLTGEPLAGVEFELMYAEGGYVDNANGHLSSNGLYYTDDHGEIHINGVTGTIVVKETRPLSGYTIEAGREQQTVTVNPQETQTLTFYNIPANTLTIQKYIDGTNNEPLAGVEFLVTDSSGAVVGSNNGYYTTDKDGRISIPGLTPGTTITVRETKTVEGYVLDGNPQTILIKEGEAQTVTFWNKRAGGLIVNKIDAVTKEPLAGVKFRITYADGSNVDMDGGRISSNGIYTTDSTGQIKITGIVGTVIVEEIETIPGYIIDPNAKSQTVQINPNDTQTLTFTNAPKQTLIIQKLVTGTNDQPLAGVEFLVTDSSGAVLGPNGGIYRTDAQGRITITDLTPGTVITAKETKTVDGYVLDSTPQSREIKSGEVQTMTFYNSPVGGLELIKVSESDKSRRIPGVTFEIRKMDGGLVTTVTTDSTGRVHADLDAGDYYAVEIEAAQGFKLDATPTYFTVQDGKTTTVTITNKPFSGILIHKTDSVTGKGIYGVTFLLYDSTNTPIGQYTSDNSGYVYIENLTVSGRYYLRELENAGYIPDTQMKTVYVTAGETTLIEWKNTPITAQIQITKKSADYNPTNGLPAGTLLEGAIFEIYDKANNLVDTIQSDSRGLAVSRPLPLGRYTIREVKAPDNYGISGTDLTAYLEHEGEIVRFEVTNKALATGVSITKTGPAEIMAGQPVRYVFSDIANSSNVRLDNFYWRDTLPAEVRLDTVVTGTYNFPGTYKITYRVNGGEYRTLADNLSTQKNYTLAASATALGLASNERVTEIMFVFGQAPAGFAQVEKPYLYCTAVANIASTSFVNVADVGGTYNGVWVQAVSRWVTKVYGKPVIPTLPRTGY